MHILLLANSHTQLFRSGPPDGVSVNAEWNLHSPFIRSRSPRAFKIRQQSSSAGIGVLCIGCQSREERRGHRRAQISGEANQSCKPNETKAKIKDTEVSEEQPPKKVQIPTRTPKEKVEEDEKKHSPNEFALRSIGDRVSGWEPRGESCWPALMRPISFCQRDQDSSVFGVGKFHEDIQQAQSVGLEAVDKGKPVKKESRKWRRTCRTTGIRPKKADPRNHHVDHGLSLVFEYQEYQYASCFIFTLDAQAVHRGAEFMI
ncbi:hypothetical protein DFH07DRAFT_764687 [Mycena maculata]|uniref:Uncharacterized protein n=1 Tax=Mycena maculata TaxID=230809 RepID=A0AAD7KCK7_9AGAR|nr:hypothetical protein DFH07DRAFT_764687 [Mycena maculata]